MSDNPLSIQCPRCHAPVDSACRTTFSGTEMNWPHFERKPMAHDSVPIKTADRMDATTDGRLPLGRVWIAPLGTPGVSPRELLKERGRLSRWFRRVVLRRPEWIEVGVTDASWEPAPASAFEADWLAAGHGVDVKIGHTVASVKRYYPQSVDERPRPVLNSEDTPER